MSNGDLLLLISAMFLARAMPAEAARVAGLLLLVLVWLLRWFA